MDTKQSKYQRAVDRARGGGDSNSSSTELDAPGGSLELSPGDLPMGALVDAAEAMKVISERVASGAWEAAPQLATIPVGKTLLDWTLEGNGPPAEFTDETTGEVREVQTWILSKGGVRISILSSVQLDKKLPPFIGQSVSITRAPDQRKGTTLFTPYLVVGEKRADGQPRNWATRPALPAAGASSANENSTPKSGAADAEALL